MFKKTPFAQWISDEVTDYMTIMDIDTAYFNTVYDTIPRIVEIKQGPEKMSAGQFKALKALSKAGVPVFIVWAWKRNGRQSVDLYDFNTNLRGTLSPIDFIQWVEQNKLPDDFEQRAQRLTGPPCSQRPSKAAGENQINLF